MHAVRLAYSSVILIQTVIIMCLSILLRYSGLDFLVELFLSTEIVFILVGVLHHIQEG